MTRFLHTRIRVADLDRSIDWYCKNLGFKISHRSDKSPSGNRIALLELPGNAHMLELCSSANYTPKVPEDLVHTCVGTEDISGFCRDLESNGLEIWPENWEQSFASGGMKMAFITDPDGYEVEILES